MNFLIIIYSTTILTDTDIGTECCTSSTGKAPRKRCAEYYAFSDEGNAGGFSNSKAQRERFAERYDFSATNATVRDEETGFGYFGARYMDFMNYVEGQGGLKTGTFSIKSWAAEKIFKKAPEQGSHSLGNL